MEKSLQDIKSIKHFENIAVSSLDQHAKYYFCAGALSSSIPRDNEEAFQKYRIQPRVLRDVSNTDLSCEILNSKVSCPIGIAPTGFHFFAHSDAEIATAVGGAQEECIFIMSCVSSTTIEDVSNRLKALPSKSVAWMQMYLFKDRYVTLDLLKRAETCGFSAVVVTVDAPVSGQWKTELPNGFVDRIKNKYLNLPRPCHLLPKDSATFDDLKWLKQQTKLPVIVKGILSGEDAAEAVKCGADAIYVSNHGERQINKVVPTMDVLEEVIEAVKGNGIDVFLDGGVRHGSDIFVAIAMGAKAVFVGRPIIWGLNTGGEEGVRRVLQILKDELLSTMQSAGAKSVKGIHRSMIKKKRISFTTVSYTHS